MPYGKGTYGSKVGRPKKKTTTARPKHRNPGAVQRAMKKEAEERKKDAEFAKKYLLSKKKK